MKSLAWFFLDFLIFGVNCAPFEAVTSNDRSGVVQSAVTPPEIVSILSERVLSVVNFKLIAC